ncbi:hypothetical protein HCX48_03670 [Rhodocyclus tenuis]|uniref:Ubiquinone biosynthesis accessory factor UbiJ n=2 Tax=Rhodocyclus TaxID=1064 RepID=A0A6L5JYM0_RHOTE|nr:hypothetical protein [Rhodocyclus gracilis]MQY52435.1 hypothetical protein [Rhodocyclus gracilis]NJA88319.1 hypothetical protein [Rhodocyclus gracilis]
MLLAGALRFVNHLLNGERWARQRLAPFSGRVARVRYRQWSFAVEVGRDGLLAPAVDADAVALVTLHLPEDAASRALSDRASIAGATRIEGSADFAEAIAFVARNLRWDAEDDLSRIVGDIAAHRLVSGGKRFAAWQRDAAQRAAQGIAEYLTFEQPTLVPHHEIDAFCNAVDELRDDLARVEKKLSRLETPSTRSTSSPAPTRTPRGTRED